MSFAAAGYGEAMSLRVQLGVAAFAGSVLPVVSGVGLAVAFGGMSAVAPEDLTGLAVAFLVAFGVSCLSAVVALAMLVYDALTRKQLDEGERAASAVGLLWPCRSRPRPHGGYGCGRAPERPVHDE